jgi:hypothetical protein
VDKPCKQCPFKRTSAQGYLGENRTEDFVQAAMGEGKMPCHSTVDYTDPQWLSKFLDGKRGTQCKGRAIFQANNCKLPRDQEVLRLKSDRKLVFSTSREFTEHHSNQRYLEDR